MGITRKTIKGSEYVYFAYYDNTSKSKQYKSCGPATNNESMIKAISLERDYLERRKDKLTKEITQIQEKINGLAKL
ncbi:MAG: hypothetical protein F4010_07045 [Cenarchaeum sp. SB0669_bin_11]|nr:hypothetical protein [Cenarchaeum sp. SB0669_bin_11]